MYKGKTKGEYCICSKDEQNILVLSAKNKVFKYSRDLECVETFLTYANKFGYRLSDDAQQLLFLDTGRVFLQEMQSHGINSFTVAQGNDMVFWAEFLDKDKIIYFKTEEKAKIFKNNLFVLDAKTGKSELYKALPDGVLRRAGSVGNTFISFLRCPVLDGNQYYSKYDNEYVLVMDYSSQENKELIIKPQDENCYAICGAENGYACSNDGEKLFIITGEHKFRKRQGLCKTDIKTGENKKILLRKQRNRGRLNEIHWLNYKGMFCVIYPELKIVKLFSENMEKVNEFPFYTFLKKLPGDNISFYDENNALNICKRSELPEKYEEMYTAMYESY